MLLREGSAEIDTPSLQVFINAAVNYALTVLGNANADLDLSNYFYS